jgi:hypothetical protein
MYDRFIGLSSNTAVLSGVLLVMRAPIDGKFLSTLPLDPGNTVEANQNIGFVVNDRSDTGRLLDLLSNYQTLEGEIESTNIRIAAIDQAIDRATKDADAFRQARVEQLSARLRENEAGITSERARVLEADSALRRSEALLVTHTGTGIAVEQARRAHAVAVSDLNVAIQKRAGVVTELEAARGGVYATDVASDRSSSQQAIDRMILLRGELNATLVAQSRRLVAMSAQAKAEQVRMDKVSYVDLEVSKARSRVVHLSAQSGEFVRQGQTIAEFTDCSRPLVITTVDEGSFRSLRVGMKGVFKPGSTLTQLLHNTVGYEGRIVQLITPMTNAQGSNIDNKYRAVLAVYSEDLVNSCANSQVGRVSFIT